MYPWEYPATSAGEHAWEPADYLAYWLQFPAPLWPENRFRVKVPGHNHSSSMTESQAVAALETRISRHAAYQAANPDPVIPLPPAEVERVLPDDRPA
jgi:hypothetical protein